MFVKWVEICPAKGLEKLISEENLILLSSQHLDRLFQKTVLARPKGKMPVTCVWSLFPNILVQRWTTLIGGLSIYEFQYLWMMSLRLGGLRRSPDPAGSHFPFAVARYVLWHFSHGFNYLQNLVSSGGSEMDFLQFPRAPVLRQSFITVSIN